MNILCYVKFFWILYVLLIIKKYLVLSDFEMQYFHKKKKKKSVMKL